MATFIYVQLGDTFCNTLVPFAQFNSERNPSSRHILITSQLEHYKDFNGEVHYVEIDVIKKYALNFILKHQERTKVSKGYWIYAIIRFFAIFDFLKSNEIGFPIIHLESDVLCYLGDQEMVSITSSLHKAGLPRLNHDEGIASTVIFPNFESVNTFISDYSTHLNNSTTWVNDMTILGKMLNSGQVQELPSFDIESIKNSIGLIFDGAAFGQYLLGVDPLHNHGKRISGYKNATYSHNLALAEWSNDSNQNLILKFNEFGTFRIATLHIHSKTLLALNSFDSVFWQSRLKEANHIHVRAVYELDDTNRMSKYPSFFWKLYFPFKRFLRRNSRYSN